ncbi:MOSC domain-containing protein [Oxalobacteraceae bacterium R-40]|uniref:MOSC domain-containing protein n=1 Tax=Keguizhuia sedimenti TaxID=3064264 RepID=A0ABU1BKC2_9BURK|nr:MOSC domain-containing protein [Oxalobacteraceae bacterium R-40]
MKVVSINCAPVGNLFMSDDSGMRRIATAIHKQPVHVPVEVRKLGIVGDEQADRSIHGGRDKAVYAYPIEHYSFWIAQRAKMLKQEENLPLGFMGENLTLEGLLENEVWVGDRLQIGSVLMEVTEPRTPCFKFNVKMRMSHAAKLMVQSGYSGFYMRVLQEGRMQAGDAVVLQPGAHRMTIASLNDQRRLGRQADLF